MNRVFLLAAIWLSTLFVIGGQVIANTTEHAQHPLENNKNSCTVVINEFMSARQRITADMAHESHIELTPRSDSIVTAVLKTDLVD